MAKTWVNDYGDVPAWYWPVARALRAERRSLDFRERMAATRRARVVMAMLGGLASAVGPLPLDRR